MAKKPKSFPEESIKFRDTSDNSLNSGGNYTDNDKTRVKFDGSCLKQENVTLDHKAILYCLRNKFIAD